MTIRHLKTFIAVCDLGSVSKAAEELHVAQPAVSQTIAELESYYNVILFDRIGRRLNLTESGRKLLVKARETAVSFNDFENIARESGNLAAVRLGASLTIGKMYLPKIIKAIRGGQEGIKLSVKVSRTSEIEEEILKGGLDFALVEGVVRSKNIRYESLCRDKLVTVCSPKFKIPKSITAEELLAFPLLLREKGSGSRDLIDGVFSAKGKAAEPFLESSSNQALVASAMQGVGVTVLPYPIVAEYVAANKLKTVALEDCDLEREYKLIYHRDKRFNASQNSALNICKSYFESRI